MSEIRPKSVAVIGHAFMGKAHSQAWRNVGAFFEVPGVRRAVLVGRDPARTRAAAEQYGWEESSTDWRATVARDDIDIVDVCVPGFSHAELAIAALDAGKHVIVEKPMASSLADAERMAEAAEAAEARGQRAIVNFNYRRVPALALARKLIAGGRLGEVRQVRGAYLQDWLTDPTAPMSWRLRREQAGSGVLGDLGSHLADITMHLTGEPITGVSGGLRTFVAQRPAGDGGDGGIVGIAAATGSERMEAVTVDDATWLSGQLQGGGLVTLEASRMALGRKNAMTIQIYGSRGGLMFDLEHLNELWFFDGADAAGEQGYQRILVTEADHPYGGHWWPDGHILGWEHTFVHQFAEFLTALDADEAVSPSFADALRVQRVLQGVEDSAARAGQFISIETKESS